MLYYPWNQSGQVSQWREFKAGRTTPAQSAQFLPQPPEELFDTREDPHEVNNLSRNPEYAEQLAVMRLELDRQILSARDAGFVPEPMMEVIDRDSSTTLYDFCQSKEDYHLEEIMKVAGIANQQDEETIPVLSENLKNDDPIIRYWSALGLRALGKKAEPALKEIEAALDDPEASVRITAMMALGNLGEPERAVSLLINEAKLATTDAHANWALDGIRYLDAPQAVIGMDEKELARGGYSNRTYQHLAHGGSMIRPAIPEDTP